MCKGKKVEEEAGERICFIHDKLRQLLDVQTDRAVITSGRVQAGEEHLIVMSICTVFKAMGERSVEGR